VLLTFVEHDDGAVGEVALEALTAGHAVASELGTSQEAVLVGAGAERAVDALRGHGVARAHVVDHDALDAYTPQAYADAIVELMAALEPDAVLAPGSEKGNEVLAHVAARTDLPMAANCTEVATGDTWRLTRLRWGGSLLEEAELDAPTKLLTAAPHAFPAAAVDGDGEIEVVPFTPQVADEALTTRVVDREAEGAGVSLASAHVVVSGGRGVGSAEGFAVLEELADLLGGAVGCSRVATNNGWRSHRDQVGQTGTRIAPQLYIACGISGATQHWVGCKDSKNILAVNTDPEAPLVTRGHYAVIGNLGEVLPAVVDEVRRRKGA
jgi:electron transfer flavoprotein alpha subunit